MTTKSSVQREIGIVMESKWMRDVLMFAKTRGYDPATRVHGFSDLDAIVRSYYEHLTQARTPSAELTAYGAISRAAVTDIPTDDEQQRVARYKSASNVDSDIAIAVARKSTEIGAYARPEPLEITGKVSVASTIVSDLITDKGAIKFMDDAMGKVLQTMKNDISEPENVTLHDYVMGIIGVPENPVTTHQRVDVSPLLAEFPDVGVRLYRAVIDQILCNYPEIINAYAFGNNLNKVLMQFITEWKFGTRPVHEPISIGVSLLNLYRRLYKLKQPAAELARDLDGALADLSADSKKFYIGLIDRTTWVLNQYAKDNPDLLEGGFQDFWIPQQTKVGARDAKSEWMDDT